MVRTRFWSDRELEYLADNVGLKSYAELSKKLGRSEHAIKLCRCRRRLPTFYDGNYYSCSVLSRELGRSRASIRKYYQRGWLKGRVATWIGRYGKRPMIFLEEDIVAFLQKCYHLFNWHQMPNIYFRNVVKECYGQ